MVLGVIGGMGPAATFDFCSRLTAAMPARRDQDHPRILVDCDPSVPDRNAAARNNGPDPGPHIARMALGLVQRGADILAMPCNAAHAFRPEIERVTPGRLIDMIDASTAEATANGAARVAILAADGCLRAGLYQRAIAARGAEVMVLEPEDQGRFMELIYRIKSGDAGPQVRDGMRVLAGRLVASGADAVIAGCTEAPLVMDAADVPAPLVSCTDALVRAVITRLQAS
jgi:aspartate racemase